MEQDFVGTKRWIRQASPYETYMAEQDLPVHRGTIGFYDIRDLPLGRWKRMGVEGAFLELNGCGGLQGIHVLQVPGASAVHRAKISTPSTLPPSGASTITLPSRRHSASSMSRRSGPGGTDGMRNDSEDPRPIR